MKRIRNQKSLYDESGGILSFVMILVLSMTLLATASMTLAKTQLSVSNSGRRTSNSYHLARSGAEKIVDTMNKEIAKELPRLMEKANEKTQSKLLNDGVKYKLEDGEIVNSYTGKYLGIENTNEYKMKLKELVYEHINDCFVEENRTPYYEVPLDTKKNIATQITTKIYSNPSPTSAPDEIKNIVSKLATKDNIGVNKDKKDAFMVEVIAQASEGSKTSLAKSRVVGTIALEELLEDDELLEEYEWTGTTYPEALQAAIISFGDFIIQGDYKATIIGDIHVKGTQRNATPAEYVAKRFPEPDQWGGITVSDGGKLEILKRSKEPFGGNAFVVSNIQTLNSYVDENLNGAKQTQISIAKDAIANTIAIHDSYYEEVITPGDEKDENIQPWNNYIENNTVKITENAYVDDDIRIDRYVDGGKIEIGESAFGISDRDTKGLTSDADLTIVNPNKNSGIFALGKNSVITMKRAFIAGQAFINFGDGTFQRLQESAGEPFQEVYYLGETGKEYDPNIDYIDKFKNVINTEKIKITGINKISVDGISSDNPYAYAPAKISGKIGSEANGNIYNVKTGVGFVKGQSEAIKLFYEGYDTDTETGIGPGVPTAENWWIDLAQNSDLGEIIPSTLLKWSDLICDPLGFYTGKNPYKKQYLPPETVTSVPAKSEYAKSEEFKGLQAYMLAKRGVFYKELEKTQDSDIDKPSKYKPVERKFEDLISVNVFKEGHKWSYNNPIYVISPLETPNPDLPLEIPIDISQFADIPTAIVCTKANTIIQFTGNGTFEGIIITPGKVEIRGNMIINGSIIAGNEYEALNNPTEPADPADPVDPTGPVKLPDLPSRKAIREGDHAGVQISAENVVINYEPNMLLAIRFMDKSLQRKLYDSLKITNYKGAILVDIKEDDDEATRQAKEQANINIILGEKDKRIIQLSKNSVITSEQGGLKFVMKSLRKL